MISTKVKEYSSYVDYGDCGGTGSYYRHPFGGVYSDGVKEFAEKNEAFWLIDAIFSHRNNLPIDDTTIIYCHVEDGKAILFHMPTDDETKVLQKIDFTTLEQDARFYYSGYEKILCTLNER